MPDKKIDLLDPRRWSLMRLASFGDTERLGAVRHIEGRKKGQPLGAAANRKKAAGFLKVIIKLAKEVWQRKPELKSNLAATARAIESKKDEALKLGPFSHRGAEAIRKHLSRARTEGLL